MSSDHNGIFKVPNLLLLDIDRPLPIGTHVSYVNTAREGIHATVVQAGYYVLVVYNDDHSISIIRYADLVAVGQHATAAAVPAHVNINTDEALAAWEEQVHYDIITDLGKKK